MGPITHYGLNYGSHGYHIWALHIPQGSLCFTRSEDSSKSWELRVICMVITITAVGPVLWRPTWLNIHSMPAQKENQIAGALRIITVPPGDVRHMDHE